MKRLDIQGNINEIKSNQIPKLHGNNYVMSTSGSTGKKIEVLSTDFSRFFYSALMLRMSEWHMTDLTKTLMSILWTKPGVATAPDGLYQNDWGPPISNYKKTGKGILLNVTCTTAEQVNAILKYQPEYLYSYPSQLSAIAEYCIANHIKLDSLELTLSTGEAFSDKYKTNIKAAWPNIKITDVYSTEEVGNIAISCPKNDCYHINTENVYLEILDEDGKDCKPGETGKVFVTSLVNYATPLIRYELGDYAKVGDICDCGINLPVLGKIAGRKRNRLRLPTGESKFPYLGERKDFLIAGNGKQAKMFQIIQHSLSEIEIKLVMVTAYTPEEEAKIKAIHKKNLGKHFTINITYHKNIPTGPNGKFEEFISNVD